MNKIQAAFDRIETQIAERIKTGLTTQAAADHADEQSNMDLVEYCSFQNLKSLAVAQGKLTLEEGQTIYGKLGETVETFNNQPLHVKSVLLNLYGELLQWQMRSNQAETVGLAQELGL